MKTLALVLALVIPTTALADGAHPTGTGYRGYVAKDHVVPKNAVHLPTLVNWKDAAGQRHQTHLSSKDIAAFSAEIRLAGGSAQQILKTQPGSRFVPGFGGDY